MSDDLTVLAALMSGSASVPLGNVTRNLQHRFEVLSSVNEVLQFDGPVPAGALLMSLEHPDAVQVQAHLRKSLNPVAVIYQSEEASTDRMIRAIELGAVAILSPRASQEKIVRTLKHAIERFRIRRSWISTISDARNRLNVLSARQRQVLEQVVDGTTNKGIAIDLGISIKTVERHRHLIHRQTRTQSLSELVRLWCTAMRPLEAAFGLTQIAPDERERALPTSPDSPAQDRKNQGSSTFANQQF